MSAELADPALAIELPREISEPGGVVIALHGRQHPAPAAGAHPAFGAVARKAPLPGIDPSAAPGVSHTAVIVARALLEVLSGWRPASQLSRWTSYPLQQDLERRAPRKPIGARLQLRSIRVSEPAAGIAEVCALADDTAQQRVRVIALRLESRAGEWIVTRLQAG